MNKLIATIAAAAAFAAVPATAATYDAFTSFNGTNGNGGFVYGYTDGTTLTAFDASGVGTVSGQAPCVFGAGSTCLYSVANNAGLVPQASVGGSFPTVTVPANAIVVHPGNSASLSDYIAFTSATTSLYNYSISLESVGIDTTNGTGYTPFTSIGGVVTLGTRSLLPTYTSTGTLTGSLLLAAGQSFGVIVDYNGNYGGDSTGVNFTVSDVPEPATWGLLLAGFGMVGFAARRRQTSVAA